MNFEEPEAEAVVQPLGASTTLVQPHVRLQAEASTLVQGLQALGQASTMNIKEPEVKEPEAEAIVEP